jgi:hypothetical protein
VTLAVTSSEENEISWVDRVIVVATAASVTEHGPEIAVSTHSPGEHAPNAIASPRHTRPGWLGETKRW